MQCTDDRPAARRQQQRLRVLLVPLLAVAGLLGTLLGPAPASASVLSGGVGYRDHNYSTSVSAPTSDKPQSKLWWADGSWWGVLWTAASPRRYEIHKFNLGSQSTNAWSATGVAVDARRFSQSDTLFDSASNKLYVLTHVRENDTGTDPAVKFQRFGYSTSTKRYTLEVSKTIVDKRAESAVLDKDSTGKIWVTWTEDDGSGGRRVMVTHSTTSDTTYVAPYVVPVAGASGTDADDISTLVAYGDAGGRKVGVLWSNQVAGALYFASHRDGDPDSAWTRTTLCQASGCPDDHLNIKSVDADAAGRIVAVVKTSYNDKSPKVPSDPLIVVYRLDTVGGGWTSSVAWRVEQDVTRAVVLLDSSSRRVHVFAAGPCCSGGTVWTKNASFDDLRFDEGFGAPFIRTADPLAEPINNPTSTKQSVNSTTGLLVLAGIDRTRDYVHNYLPLGDTTPPTVTAIAPDPGATGVSTSPIIRATFSEPVTGVTPSTFTLSTSGTSVPASVSYDSAAQRATLSPGAALSPGTTYMVRVSGGAAGIKDGAGNPLAADRMWSFTTSSTATSQTVSLPAVADSSVTAASPTANSGTGTVLGVDASPVEISYLKFDLSPYAGRTLTGASLQLRATTSGSTGTQAVKLVADDTWSETGLTYDTRPALGSSAGTLGPTSSGTSYTVPLAVAGLQPELGGTLSIGLDSGSSDGVDLGSRETATPPVLVLVLAA